jgi:hypothetical protein
MEKKFDELGAFVPFPIKPNPIHFHVQSLSTP